MSTAVSNHQSQFMIPHQLPYETSKIKSSDLSHEELVANSLLQVLEERYFEMDKEQIDAIVMLLIQNSFDQ